MKTFTTGKYDKKKFLFCCSQLLLYCGIFAVYRKIGNSSQVNINNGNYGRLHENMNEDLKPWRNLVCSLRDSTKNPSNSYLLKTLFRDVILEDNDVHIFVLLTDCKPKIYLQTLCCIESLATMNPNYKVILGGLSNFYDGKSAELLTKLTTIYPNIMAVKVDLDEIFVGTPLENFDVDRIRGNSKYSHLSDFMRFGLLYKVGGFYVDTDVLDIQPLGPLRSIFALRPDVDVIASNFFGIPKKHNIMKYTMEMANSKYNAKVYLSAGPYALSRALRKYLKLTSRFKTGDFNNITIADYRINQKYSFNDSVNVIVKNDFKGQLNEVIEGAIVIHLNKVPHYKKPYFTPGDKSVMDLLSKQNCINIYKFIDYAIHSV